MSIPVAVNGLVPLCYLSPNKNAALFVRARIFNISDTLLATKDLTHVEDGRYTDATFFMPDAANLKVRYDVFTDAGYTAPSTDEGSVDERFHKLDTPDALIRNDELILVFDDNTGAAIVAEFSEDDGIEAEFSEDDESFTAVFAGEDVVCDFDDDAESLVATYFDC